MFSSLKNLNCPTTPLGKQNIQRRDARCDVYRNSGFGIALDALNCGKLLPFSFKRMGSSVGNALFSWIKMSMTK